MMNCLLPIDQRTSAFEIAVKEELPELYESMINLVAESPPETYVVNLYKFLDVFMILGQIYDKQGREGLRNLRKTQILADAAHENSHEDSKVPVNTDMARGS